jgi:hypothetical protein
MVRLRKRRRRWFQFGLGTLLLITFLVALGLLAYRKYLEPFRRQEEAMRVIKELGGGYQTSAGSAWQQRLFGADFQNITRVDLANCDDPDDYLPLVADLPALEILVVGGPAFDDHDLRRLHVRTLQTLVLDSTAVSDAAVDALRRRIPGVFIYLSERRAVEWLAARYRVAVGVNLPPQVQSLITSEFSSVADRVDLFLGPEFTDAKLPHIICLRHLTSLGLSSTRVTDDGLPRLKTLTKLADLDLSRSSISDEGLAHLAGLTQLRRLRLSETQITDAGLPHLHALKQLEYLDLRGTRTTPSGAEAVRKALPDCLTMAQRPPRK